MDDNTAQTDPGDVSQIAHTPGQETYGFTRQIADYFRSYVKGTLSATGLPLRTYGDTYESGLIRKLPLDKYPQLNRNIYKNFVTGLGQQTFVITQNKYTAHQDEYVLDAIRTNIAKLTERELLSLLRPLAFQAEAKLLESAEDQKDTVDNLLEISKQSISRNLIVPFILPLEDNDIVSDKKAKQLLGALHEAAVSRLYDASKELLRHIYTDYFASETHISNDSLMVKLSAVFTPKNVRDSLRRFVDDFQINDAYQQVYALHRGAAVADDASVYLYFGELAYDGQSFPLFYTKVASEHKFPSVTLTFESRIAVNKEAIEYVLRHFSARTNQPIDIAALAIPSDIHSSEEIGTMQRLVSQLQQALKLTGDQTLSKAALQESANHLVSLTNRLYFYIDTPAGSAIADDYDAIIASDDLSRKAEKYLDGLLARPTVRFVEEISENWNDKSYFDKLLPTVPLPVNDEQKQVLMALERASADHIVVDSGAATGKRHLIDASVLAALGKGWKVLVVGASAETSHRLQQAIGDILRRTTGASGHNPVFNLHDGEVFDRMDDQGVADIAASVRRVESKRDELLAAKKRKKRTLKDALAHFMQNAENVNLHEVEQTVFNERRFAGKDWIADEPIDEIGTAIQKLHRAILYVRSSEAGYLMPYIEADQQKAIEEFIASYREYEKASKDVYERLPEFVMRYRKLTPDQRQHLQDSLAYIQSNYRQFVKILKEQSASSWLAISDNSTFGEIAQQEAVLDQVLGIAQGAGRRLGGANRMVLLRELDGYDAAPADIIDAFDTYIEQVATLKSKLFGFSGRMLVVENLNKQLLKSLPSFGLPEPEKQAENMQLMSDFVRYVTEELAAAGLPAAHWKDVIHILLTDGRKIEEVEEIVSSLNQTARFDFTLGFKVHEADNLLANITLLKHATELNRIYKDFPKLGKLFGVTTMGHLLARPHEFMAKIAKLSRDLSEANRLDDAKLTIKRFVEEYPDASKRLGITFAAGNLRVTDEGFADSDNDYIKEYVAHKKQEQDIRAYFDAITTDPYAKLSIEYQQILGIELQYGLNKTLLEFVESQSDLMDAIAGALKERRKLSPDAATRLTQLFPVVTGEVRGLSGILPMDTGLFDLVIIDTADSIPVAEALPAVLRAKKVLVVGDGAQSNASGGMPVYGAINDLYAQRISSELRRKLSSESADNKNDIIAKQESALVPGRSALQFFAAYANYELSLTRQYGPYEEFASFGNEYYYGGKPVSLTSRSAPLSDLFQFAHIKTKADQVSRFTNGAEVEYIVQHLHILKEQGFAGTIGIVTPFAEQAVLLQKELDECVITDWFERRSLRVMTFDSKRQHESDYTYYSLVASDGFNELSQKLPASIGTEAFAGDTRSHRLLTGFSGNKRVMHIVHSLPFDAYGGSLSETLEFYAGKLQVASVAAKGAATDVLLDAEAKLAQAFEKTGFAQKYEGRLSLVPKYPFVNYIKPLSPGYHRAQYKIFFLAMVDDQPLVIEYDDFKDRFLQNSKNDKDNGSVYLAQQDVYGYKLLEGYGYRFLRLNKFNIGSDPVRTLDTYLTELTKSPTWPADNGFVS